MSWADPTTADIKSSASQLALVLPFITPFLFSPNAIYLQYTSPQRIDVGTWTNGGMTLVLAANMNYANESLDLVGIPGVPGKGWHVNQILNSSGAVVDGSTIVFQSVGSGAFILSSSNSPASTGKPSRATIVLPLTPCFAVNIIFTIITLARSFY